MTAQQHFVGLLQEIAVDFILFFLLDLLVGQSGQFSPQMNTIFFQGGYFMLQI